MGVMPAALSLASSDSSWAIVVGGEVMPALANRSLRYQKPTTCWSYGMPYCAPLTCQPAAAWPSSVIQLDVSELRLASLPEVNWVASWPPPHCWKMSGGLSDFRAIGILVVNRSLWIGTTLTVTFGCDAWNAAATLSQTPSRGWVLPLFHQVRVTLALLDELALVLEVLLLLLLLLLLL